MRSVRWAFLVALACAAAARADDRPPGVDFVDPRVFVLDPLDTERTAPDRVVLSGRLLGEHVAPEVTVVRPDGRAVRVEDEHVRFTPPRVVATVSLGQGPGVYRVEVTGLVPPDVRHSAARVRLFAGVPVDTPDDPEPPDTAIDPDVNGTLLEARLFALINAHRKRAKLPAYEWLEPLAVAARDHAAAMSRVGRLDHRVDVDGTVANRLRRRYGWNDLVYENPPSTPNRKPKAPSFVPTITDEGRSLEWLVYRWARAAAFCLPMTSDRMAHAGCGIVRRPDGWLYVVVTYAQLNQPAIEASIEAAHADVLRRWRAADATARPDLLRELGRWRRRAGRDEAERARGSDDPALRGAGWDVAVLHDEADARQRLLRVLGTLRAASADPARVEEARATSFWMAWMQNAPDLVREVRAIYQTLPPRPVPGGAPAGK